MNLARFSDSLLERLSQRIGDWNPQLLRELKGRFTGTTVTFILIASGLIQSLIALWLFNGILTEQRFHLGFYLGFQLLNWLLPFVSISGSIYALIADLNREQKYGTFNFIKLSPQSGSNIFLGKIVGVPSLIYLAVLSFVPLHLSLALFSGASLGLMLAWYLTIGSIAYLCLSLTSLYILYGGKYAILFALLTSQPISRAVDIYNYYLNSEISKQAWIVREAPLYTWFYLPISNNFWLLDIFTCGTILMLCNWLWIAIDRKYLNPAATLIEKQTSYWINTIVQLWSIGFALPLMKPAQLDGNFYIVAIFYTMSAVWIVCLIPAILPSRRSLQEWIQSWQQKCIGKQFNWRHPELIRELIWYDCSPSLLAIAINLAIAAIGWGLLAIGAFITSPNVNLFGQFISGVAIASILTLIYTVGVHLQCLRSHLKNNQVLPVIFLMSCFPSILGFMITISWQSSPIYKDIGHVLLLFSPLFWMGIVQLSIPTIFLTAIAQIGILMGALKIFKHQLLTIGELKMSSSSQRQFSLERGEW